MNSELMEKWKLGELEDEYYYVKLPDGEVNIECFYYLDVFKNCKDGKDIEILAPVPSYKDMEIIDDVIVKCMQANQKLLGEVKFLTEERERLIQELEDSRKYQAIQNDDIARLRNFLKIVKKLLIGIKQIVDMLICQQKIYIKHWIMLIIKELEELLQKA